MAHKMTPTRVRGSVAKPNTYCTFPNFRGLCGSERRLLMRDVGFDPAVQLFGREHLLPLPYSTQMYKWVPSPARGVFLAID